MPTPDPITPDDLTELRRIVARLGDQDERCTNEPSFCVQKKVRLITDTELVDDGHILFTEDGQEVDSDHWERLEEAHRNGDDELVIDEDTTYHLSNLCRWGFKYAWKTVQVCLTEEGAQHYINADGHNLSEYGAPRIYVESFYRNREMIALRRLLPKVVPLIDAAACVVTGFADVERFEAVNHDRLDLIEKLETELHQIGAYPPKPKEETPHG